MQRLIKRLDGVEVAGEDAGVGLVQMMGGRSELGRALGRVGGEGLEVGGAEAQGLGVGQGDVDEEGVALHRGEGVVEAEDGGDGEGVRDEHAGA